MPPHRHTGISTQTAVGFATVLSYQKRVAMPAAIFTHKNHAQRKAPQILRRVLLERTHLDLRQLCYRLQCVHAAAGGVGDELRYEGGVRHVP